MPGAEAAHLFDDICEAGQHPWRGNRELPKDRKADQVGQDQVVAQRPVDVGPAPPGPNCDGRREPEDRIVVEVRGYVGDPVVVCEPMVQVPLGRNVEPLLE